jgi:hypothetical protein
MNQVDLSSCSSRSLVETLCDADFCNRHSFVEDYGIGQVESNFRRQWTIKRAEDETKEREEIEFDHIRGKQ